MNVLVEKLTLRIPGSGINGLAERRRAQELAERIAAGLANADWSEPVGTPARLRLRIQAAANDAPDALEDRVVREILEAVRRGE